MDNPVQYELDGSVAVIRLDDGRVNVLSPPILVALGDALTRAESEASAVLLTGRPGVFSAGFDLKIIRGQGEAYLSMVRAGFELCERILGSGIPVVIACPGHAIAMGSFILLSADYRVGVRGDFRIGPNEVALGLRIPDAVIVLCRQRLTPAAFNRSIVNAEFFSGDGAVEAGFLDRVVDESELFTAAREEAVRLGAFDRDAFHWAKQQARGETLRALRTAIEVDDARRRGL